MPGSRWSTKPQNEKSWDFRVHAELPVAYLAMVGMSSSEDSAKIGEKCMEFAREVNGPWFLLTDLRGFKIAAPAGRDAWIQNMRAAVRANLRRWVVVAEPGMASFQTQNVSASADLRAITSFTASFEEADRLLRTAAEAVSKPA